MGTNVKFNKMEPEMAFAGLTDSAIKFIGDEGKWEPCPEKVSGQIDSPAYLVAIDMETRRALYTLIIRDNGLMVANISGRIINESAQDDLLMFLLKYPLKDGSIAEAYKQREESGVLNLALMVNGENRFEWAEEDLKAALEDIEEG